MSISDNYVPLRQIGNGVTVAFSAGWSMISSAYARVYLEDAVTGVQTPVTEGPGASQYTIALTASGFTVTFNTAPTSAYYVVIGREVALDQTDPYRTSVGFDGKVLEASLDKLTAMIQDQGDSISRSLRFPLGDTTSGTLLSANARKGLALIFNSVTGAPEVGAVSGATVSAAMVPVVGASTVSAALALLGGAPLASPVFTGNPTAPTPSAGDNDTSIATTAFVMNALGNSANDFRLTLSSGVPVTTSDVSGATTLYCTPFKGNRIALYDGTNWNVRTSSQFSLALGTLTSGRPYDVFCYDNAGVPTLEFLAWTNDTTRATALVYQDGVLVKSGAATRRYLGTFYTTSTTTTEDSEANRYLWNYYNRTSRSLLRRESTSTWTYTTATVRQANGSTANQVNFVIGVAEDALAASLNSSVNTLGDAEVVVGLGYDSTTVMNKGVGGRDKANNRTTSLSCNARFIPDAGRHYLAWLETSTAIGTTTWFGAWTAIGTTVYSGISAEVMA